jgi:hypothetical protein
MVDKCYICKRGKRELNTLFKEILTPFRAKVKALDERYGTIIKEGKEKMEAFKVKHEGNDYLNFNFQTVKTDREQFEKLIPDMEEFFTFQNYRTYKKFNNKVKLQEVVDYVNSPDFWEISLKKKYINGDPRIELKKILKTKEEWNRLISDFDLGTYSYRMFSKKDFEFLDKEEREEVVSEFSKMTNDIFVCPVCMELLRSAGKGTLKFK